MTFDPNNIRADIETQVQRLFSPPVYSEGVTYEPYMAVQHEGLVYINKVQSTPGAFDPLQWILQGPVYPVLFENVTSKIPIDGAIRVLISWGQTSQKYLPCYCGAPGMEVDGVLTVFAYTPFNEGTIAGLNAIKRLRDAIPIWDQLPDLIQGDRPCYSVTQPNGPRASFAEAGSDYFTHNITATLTAEDAGSPLL